MKRRPLSIAAVVTIPLIAAGCTTSEAFNGISAPMAGFTTVAARAESVTGKKTVWVQSSEEARTVSERVKSLVQKKTIGPDTAVQVALLNNKGLQAAYAEIGLSAADMWQESMLVNPTISVGMIGVDPVRTIEGAVVSNILALATHKRRVAVADARFRQAQLRAAEETLRLAADTRRAWINAV
ncbi:TolC family protein, partial [Mesorhizobium sp. M5C.F.Ca.IN.020.14.1.1]